MASSVKLPTLTLATGTEIPQVAFGIAFRRPTDPFEQHRAEAFAEALKLGYTHIDGAAIYMTEPEVGWAIKHSGLKREDIFLTSKTHPTLGIARKDIMSDLRKSLDDFGVDYVDLYLIHNPFFPNPTEFGLKEAWTQMEKIKELGLAKEIGISNFEPEDIEKLLKIAKIKPVVNQIELHPNIYEASKPVIEYCKANHITIEGYAPLMTIGRGASKLSDTSLPGLVNDIASKYSVTPAQILIKWQLQRGFIPVTSSLNIERQKAQIQLFGWEMEEAELLKIEEAGREKSFRLFGWGTPATEYKSVL